MRDNGILSGQEIELRDDQIIVSRSGLDGRIVYANSVFVEISGFAEDELLGQQHNILRHPEMPSEVFADLWVDLKSGRPWIGVLKNRCKNGDAYWVEAHVSPIWERGVIIGYMSMRRKPSRAQIAAAEKIYAAIRENQHEGFIFRHGGALATTPFAMLKNAFFEASIAFKFVLTSLLAAVAMLACFAYFLTAGVSAVLDGEARIRLRHDISLVKTAVEARVNGIRNGAVDHARTFSERVYSALGGNQGASRESIEALAKRAGAERNNPIDFFIDDLKGVATVFVRTPEGFLRKMTSLKNSAGGSLAGTYLEEDNPSLTALQAGHAYVGQAQLFGRNYMTSYSPIFNVDGEVVGATLIGLDLSAELDFLKSELRSLKVGATGYYYMVDMAPGPRFGTLLLHPFKEGQKITDADPANGRDILAKLAKLRQGEIVYSWMNTEAGETSPRDKLVIFETMKDPLWVVAGGSSLDEFTALSGRIAWLVVGGGLAMASTIFAIILLLLRALIVRPLNTQVLPAFHAMSAGSFETRLNVQGSDEIAQVIQGLECLQNRLAFDTEQTREVAVVREMARLEAENLSRARADFLANMSHEIRTPMNAVIGFAYLLLQSELSKRDRDYVKRIEGAGKLLLAIVNDILDFSKIDAGKMHLDESAFHLDDVLESLASIVRDRVQEKNLILEYVVAPDVPQALHGDALRLSQVLINLVGNAIKFTAEGSVIVFVSAQLKGDQKVQLDFRIQDSGIGMSPAQLAKLFQAFSQADSSITRKYGGTGLGLVICKRLVEMMRGEIWVDSQLHVGSAFCFNVQLGIEDREAVPARKLPYRILVVDDNELARKVLAALLEKNGCSVQTVDSGEAGLALLQDQANRPFDCAFLDLNMPGMNGLTLAYHMRSQFGQRTKLVMISATNIHDAAYRDALGDFDSVLEKPVTAAKIAEVLAGFEVGSPHSKGLVKLGPRAAPLAGMRIMVAEDVPTNQLIMRDILDAMGATVEMADNGRIAVQYLTMHGDGIDVILMDLQMPEMDGLEATRRIRGGQVRADIPIIALTAHALEEERQRALAAGMNDFLTKPIDPAQLIEVLQRWCSKISPSSPLAVPAVAPPPSEMAFPDLPGIDTENGLQRLLNRQSLYEKVLRDFYTRFKGETERIRAALGAQEIEEATRLAHSVKGVGSTIGATELAKLASELQNAIKESRADLDACLENFDRELNRVLGGIQQGFGLDQQV